MDKLISKLFSDYLSEQSIVTNKEYSTLTKIALEKENLFCSELIDNQAMHFEELLDITSQIHFLEVKDAFIRGCQLGAKVSKEFVI